MIKTAGKILKKIKSGFTITELIIGITMFSVIMASITFGISSMFKMEIRSKERIYEAAGKADKIYEEYYIKTDK